MENPRLSPSSGRNTVLRYPASNDAAVFSCSRAEGECMKSDWAGKFNLLPSEAQTSEDAKPPQPLNFDAASWRIRIHPAIWTVLAPGPGRGRVWVWSPPKGLQDPPLVWSINESVCTLIHDARIKDHSTVPIFPQCAFRSHAYTRMKGTFYPFRRGPILFTVGEAVRSMCGSSGK